MQEKAGTGPGNFTEWERRVLHSLANTFQDKEDLDTLNSIMASGATLKEIVTAYRSQKWLVGRIKVLAGLVAAVAAAWAALKGAGWVGR